MSTANIRQNSIAAVCEALGVPQKDWPLFSRRSAGPLTPRAVDALNQYVDDIHNFVAALVTGAD